MMFLLSPSLVLFEMLTGVPKFVGVKGGQTVSRTALTICSLFGRGPLATAINDRVRREVLEHFLYLFTDLRSL
jgi:hypothetical protein